MERSDDLRLKSGNSIGTASRVITLLLYFLAGVAAMGVGTAAQKRPPVVRVDSGEVQGVADDGVVSYKGIPFATPPVGELRWRPPQPAERWTGVRQAAEFGADCMQGRFGPPPARRRQRIACFSTSGVPRAPRREPSCP